MAQMARVKGWNLRLLSLLMFAAMRSRAQAADPFEASLTFGKDTVRAVASPGRDSFMRSGVDPIQSGEWTLRASVPEQWAKAPPDVLTPVDRILRDSDAEAATLAQMVRAAGWEVPGDHLATARRVVALLHVAAPDAQRPLGRDLRIWHPWELIAEPQRADTLSAAVASMLVLDHLSIEADLSLYPWDGGNAYGIVMDGTPKTATPDILSIAGGRAVVSCHPNARPVAPPLAEWSRAEVASSGWSGEAAGPRGPKPERPVVAPPTSAGGDSGGWLALSAAVVVAVASVGGFSAFEARRRRRRIDARKAGTRRDSFS